MNNDRIIVLGMHRSGTSCLTGLLQQVGLTLGNVVESAPHNNKGNRENLDIRALNDAVLRYNNSAWDSPPTELYWNNQHAMKRDQIIQRYAESDIWGFKDPRTVLTLPFWLEGLTREKLQFIATFRHPLLVAKSLNQRDPDLTIEKGLILWRQYNEKILEYYDQHAFPVLNFDLDSTSYLLSFRAAVRRLEMLEISPDNQLDFFDDNHRHQTILGSEELQRNKRILDPAIPIYEKLRSLP